ncbi:hypothetical protein [Arenibacterium halophilum]|uniref:HEAT repeat domain-containing protein n=1 Tax=Arenibacterium halophilum TaxID=2583821 RepID=A0ABY2X848_9RHOB|nr:hypothetical protein [Arenibacterium halophilum]TMV12540.1 hypothetical protein FGK64_06910 [Arenibacterium halophilum]
MEEQAATLNPYASLLNDPDPARSLAAMQILMESGDEALVNIALEFGLLSADTNVQKLALDSYLATEPVLSIVLDGSSVNVSDFSEALTGGRAGGHLSGAVDANGIGTFEVRVGEYDSSQNCFLLGGLDTCLLITTPSNVNFTHPLIRGSLSITPEGTLAGDVRIGDFGENIPMVINILD